MHAVVHQLAFTYWYRIIFPIIETSIYICFALSLNASWSWLNVVNDGWRLKLGWVLLLTEHTEERITHFWTSCVFAGIDCSSSTWSWLRISSSVTCQHVFLFAASLASVGWYRLFTTSARGSEQDGDWRAVTRLGKLQTRWTQFWCLLPVADVCFLYPESGRHTESALSVSRQCGLPQRSCSED